MVCDSTLLFGARRNVPQRYDRDLVNKTLDAMKRVAEIRARRERVFYKKRMSGNRARQVARARRVVAENEHLLPRLRGSELKRMEEERLEAGDAQMEIDEDVRTDALIKKSKSRVFGGEKRRLKVRINGDVETMEE